MQVFKMYRVKCTFAKIQRGKMHFAQYLIFIIIIQKFIYI